MKHAALMLLLWCLCCYAQAQDDDDVFGLQSEIFGAELSFSKGAPPVWADSPKQAYNSWKPIYKTKDCFFRQYEIDSNFAYQLSPGSYMYVGIPYFSYVGGVKHVRFRDGTKGLVLFGSQDAYGSGGGAQSSGFMVISAGERPQMLFKVITYCGNETFAREYDQGVTTEASLTSYDRKVDFKNNGDIIIHPNTPELAKINKHETCDITDIVSGTYRYVDGKYEKVKIQKPKTKKIIWLKE